jgi:hypothetical protein
MLVFFPYQETVYRDLWQLLQEPKQSGTLFKRAETVESRLFCRILSHIDS